MMHEMNEPLHFFATLGLHVTVWTLIGYFGASLFAARWVVQFFAARRAGRAVIPRAFWVMSVAGSGITLCYFTFSPKHDSVGILQNLLPACTACYSLYIDIRSRGWRGSSL